MIVPIYNVRPYLAECLDSLLAQTYHDLELILVDDGSTDGSSQIAAAYAQRNTVIRVISTENRGLGAARNIGLRCASGEFIAFADSDDTVPLDAYDLMVGVLQQTGSDFVVGSVRQVSTDGTIVPWWIGRLHRERRLGIRFDEFPAIMHDVLAPNKVFRREFWDRAGLRFPEGLRYEDQVTLTEAYLKAERLDVLQRPVYNWRVRHDGSSITQNRHELADLRDRTLTKQMTTDIVRRLGSAEAQRLWFRRGLVGDLPLYFAHVPYCEDEYWEVLHHDVRRLLDGTPGIENSDLPIAQRLLGWLVANGRRSEATALATFLRESPRQLRVEVRDGSLVAQVPFPERPQAGIPRDVLVVRAHDVQMQVQLTAVDWCGPVIEVHGVDEIRGVAAGSRARIMAWWEESRSGARRRCEVDRLADGSFVARLDMAHDEMALGTWRLNLTARLGHLALASSPRSALSLPASALPTWSGGEVSAHPRIASDGCLAMHLRSRANSLLASHAAHDEPGRQRTD